ncbi:NlpC/P60 family protein [Sporolactobacillus shoreae]|uniref:NlpC/P60 family protein n=1 Tax=Sporolactobacillus shoreae TaxID=1465501 RepID=A0A4Z0GMT6_9BACL|nr:C40 family peptidase [Sporolactobacillus shoreae]TGA97473.1 NlpC/P60 family protein [Sporolactobacillus shoreae]
MQIKRVGVPVASVWTDPDSVRPIDAPAVTARPDIAGWLAQMTRKQTIDLCDEKRLQTQVLFGDDVIVDDIRGNWAKVVVPSQASAKDTRGYPGWVPAVQLSSPNLGAGREKVMVQSKQALFKNENQLPVFSLSFGTFLDLIDVQGAAVRVDSPAGTGYVNTSDVIFPFRRPKDTGEEIVANAMRFLDLPYLWSGMSAYGYDCSGFSYSMLRAGGYLIPRDADDQSVKGREIPKAEMKPGDLLYFAYEQGKGYVHHVGIYAGDGKMVHSPTPGKKVSLTELAGTIFEEELCTVRRYWKEN